MFVRRTSRAPRRDATSTSTVGGTVAAMRAAWWWCAWAAVCGCANTTQSTSADVPDAATVPDVVSPDVVSPDVPTSDVAVVDARVDAGAPTDVAMGPCQWRAGALVDPIVGPVVSMQLDDAIVSGDRVALVAHIYDGSDPVALTLHRLTYDGHLDGAATTFGDASENSGRVSLALRPGGAGLAALTSGSTRASLYLFGPAGAVERVDLSAPMTQGLGLLASSSGFTFARVLATTPRVHEVSLDAAGAVLSDQTSAIDLLPENVIGVGPVVVLRSLQRVTAADGSAVTVAAQQQGLTSDRGASTRVSYAVTRAGGAAGGAVTTFDDRDITTGITVMPGRMLAYARTYVIDHVGLAGGTFVVQPIDDTGRPSASAVVWDLPNFGNVPTAAADTAHGPIAVVPIAHNVPSTRDYATDRFVARAIAADGHPAGAELTLPLPTGDVRYDSMLLRATPDGALLLAVIVANDTGRRRLVSVPLRCE